MIYLMAIGIVLLAIIAYAELAMFKFLGKKYNGERRVSELERQLMRKNEIVEMLVRENAVLQNKRGR